MVDDLIKIMGIIPYRGCTIEKVQGGFKAFGKVYPTQYLAEKRIDLAHNKFKHLKIYR